MHPGETSLIPISLKNTGTVNLHSLKFYSSTTEYISFEINPKEIYEMGYGDSSIILVSLDLADDMPPGKYDISFDVQGIEVKRSGVITLNVSSVPKSIRDEVHDTIINYEYLINEVSREMNSTNLRELNTTRAEGYMDDARSNLQKAKDYFDEGNYEDAMNTLVPVKSDLEDTVFELAVITYKSHEYQVVNPLLVILLLVVIVVAALILLYSYNKRKSIRPKLIRAFTEEEA
jgi:hypothetical protein